MTAQACEPAGTMRETCLAIIHEEGPGSTHGAGAWKVMQACMKMKARIKALPDAEDALRARVAALEGALYRLAEAVDNAGWGRNSSALDRDIAIARAALAGTPRETEGGEVA